MKQIPSAAFRKNYAKEATPVEVTAFGRVIGTWFPVGADIDAPDFESEQPPAVAAEIAEPRMTIRPAMGIPRRLIGQAQRIQDPIALRRLEHDRTEQLASRTFGRARPTRQS